MPRGSTAQAAAGQTPADSYADWAGALAPLTGVPARALAAFAVAQDDLVSEDPDCGLSWPTLAGIGYVESANGGAGGGLLASGSPLTPIVGVALSGRGAVAAVPDSDNGAYDGDSTLDRAIGPLQFLPSTWTVWRADGDRDGVKNPQDIDDASLAAARYLCASGDLTTPSGWNAAVLSYNHSSEYLVAVETATNTFAQRSRSAPPD